MSTKDPQQQQIQNQRNEARKKLYEVQGSLSYFLEVFGDQLGARQGWKNDLDGIDAVHYFLIQKHNWTPAQVRSMTHEDLRFALSEEMQGWTVPKGTP